MLHIRCRACILVHPAYSQPCPSLLFRTSSSDEDDYNRASSSAGPSGSNNRAWKDFVNEDEARNDRNLLDPDDPFGDSAGVEVSTPGIYDKPRAHVW